MKGILSFKTLKVIGDQNHTLWQGKSFFTGIHEQGSGISSCFESFCQNSYLSAVTEEMWRKVDKAVGNERKILHLNQNEMKKSCIKTLLKERCESASILRSVRKKQ